MTLNQVGLKMYFMPMGNKERNKQKITDPLVFIRGP